MFYIIVILAGIFAMPASAQSLKDQIIGAWTLVSCFNASFPPCAGNNGIFIVDASGHYAWMEAARGRSKVNPVKISQAQIEMHLHRSNTRR